jgi:hypothetical protein
MINETRTDAVMWLYGQLCKHSRLESNRMSIKEKRFERIFERAKVMVTDDPIKDDSVHPPVSCTEDHLRAAFEAGATGLKTFDQWMVEWRISGQG